MKILIKHIIRNMQENIGRTTMIMLSLFVVSILVAIISLGIIFFVMVTDASVNMASFEYTIESATTGDKIINTMVDKAKEKFEILGMAEPEYGYLMNSNNEYETVALDGFWIEQAVNFKFINLNNEKNIELEDNEAIITSKVSETYKLKKGDEFEYYGRNGKKYTLKVKYVVKSLTELSPISIITNENTYLNITEEAELKYYLMFGNYKEEYDNLEEDVELLESEYGLNFNKYDGSVIEMILSFLYPAIIILILVFAVIFVSLNSIVKIIINERSPVIGTFRSIGATKKQIIGVLILEMLMYTVIPSILGAMFGVAATKGISSLLEYTLTIFGSSEKLQISDYMLKIGIITVVFTVLFQMLLSIFELIKILNMSIKDSIFNKHTSTYKYSSTKCIIGIFLMIVGIVTILKQEQLTYWYCLIGILSIFISIALIVPIISRLLINILEKSKNPIITMATNTLKNSRLQINTNIIFIITASVSLIVYSFFNYMSIVEKNKENVVNADIYVEEMGEELYDKTDEFYKIDNVKSVSALYDITIDQYVYDKITFANRNIKEIHLVYSNDYEKLTQDTTLVDIGATTSKNLSKYEIIVSEYYQNIYNLKVGDIIVLEWKSEENNFILNTPLNLKIVDFADTSKYKNNSIIVSEKLGQELNELLFNGFSNTKYFLNLNDNSKEGAKETRKTIIYELGILSNGMTGNVFTKEGYVKNAQHNAANYMKFLGFIVVVVVGLALIGIINNQTVSFMERRKELTTLYSIAMSRKQIKNMILIENILAFINSTIASIVFYIILSKIIELILQVLLIPITIKFTITGILVLLLIVAMILLVIQRSMRKHIKNMNIVEEIKYE